MFAIWDETGQEHGLNLLQLQQRLSTYQGEVMVRYRNRLGLPATLFLTVRQGQAYQRFKAGNPPLDWHWLGQAIHLMHVPDDNIHQMNNARRQVAN
ncbi:hypothetical protein [Aeromonas veronii]|uniref:hypothetical protein n=1 Tax=Aeromonas veronii TaxID=654 RepID=UPI0032ECDF05